MFLLSASTLGILGIILTSLCFIAKISNVYNYSKSYTFPIAPYEKEYLNKTLVKKEINNNLKRSKLLASNNIIRGRKMP